MRITFQPVRQTQSGFALLIVLCFLLVSLVVFASVMSWVSNNATITQRNIVFNQSEAAAESATEYVISQMLSDFKTL
jgi:Tfp pilus assembly protein PilX